MRLITKILTVLTLLLAGSSLAHAQFDILPEIRAGIMSHDVGSGNQGLLDPARMSDANVELLFSLGDLSNVLIVGELRPHIGATLNLKGQESFAYTGLSFTADVPLLPVFVEASLGAAIHGTPFANQARTKLAAGAGTPLAGKLIAAPAQRFGCAAVARASASIGLNVLPGASLIGTIEHYSDGGLCGLANNGVTNIGIRAGIRF